MKRIAYVLVAAVIIAAGALAALPLMVSGEFVRQQIVENVASLTGREITFRDAPRITFNPFLGVELDDVVLADAGAASGKPLVRMERLQGQLRILPAISGRAEIASYRFVRPQFSVEVSGDGKVNWASPKGRIRAVLDEARAKRETTPAGQKPDLSSVAAVSLGRVEIVDGTVEYVDNRSGHKETFTNVNGQFSWPGTLSTWSMSGKGIWRNEAFEFAAGSSQPLMLLSGGTAPATIRLSSSALEFSFDGEANLIADLHLAGAGKLSTPSLRRFAGLFGAALPPGSTLSAFSVSGTLDATPGKLAFKDADIQLDGNSGRGALQLSLAKAMRPKLSGTIAAGQVDLSPYLAEI
nr:AsmA family protein [Nitratireductor sp.]